MKLIGFFLGLGAKVKLYALMFAGFVAVLGMAVLKGQSIQRAKEARKDAKAYRKTTERIADAKPIDRDANNARERLRDRNKR